jgi:predicted transporter
MLAVLAVVLGDAMSFEEALSLASRDESFKATVYAMNTLLIGKGIYTQEEFEALFVEWVRKEQRRSGARERSQDSMPCPA